MNVCTMQHGGEFCGAIMGDGALVMVNIVKAYPTSAEDGSELLFSVELQVAVLRLSAQIIGDSDEFHVDESRFLVAEMLPFAPDSLKFRETIQLEMNKGEWNAETPETALVDVSVVRLDRERSLYSSRYVFTRSLYETSLILLLVGCCWLE